MQQLIHSSHTKKHIGFEIDIGESIGDVGIDNTIGIDLHDDFGLCINVDINIGVDLDISIDIDAGIWEGIYLVDIDVGIRVKNGFDFGRGIDIGIDGGIMFVSGVSLNSMNHCSIDDPLIENVWLNNGAPFISVDLIVIIILYYYTDRGGRGGSIINYGRYEVDPNFGFPVQT